MKKIIFLCIFCLLGCASAQGYEDYLMQFKSMSKAQLLDIKGVPDRVYEYNGVEYLVYIYSASYHVPQTSFVDSYDSYGYTNASISSYGGYSGTVSCKTTFCIEKGIVTSMRYIGNACRA